jgi:transposase InsO family protein
MQVYGAILPGTRTVDRLLPRAAHAARAGPTLSRQERQRLKMLQWYEDHGRNARLTCRRFGVSPDTFYRWWRRYQRAGPRALEDRSHRPHQARQPTWSPELAQAVLGLRQAHPGWGKDKLVVLLRQAGWQVSTSMVGRILRRLDQEGRLPKADLRDPCILRRSSPRPYATRRPRDYQVAAPGDLVQVDTADIRPLPGVVYKHFTARDVVSRWDVLDVYHRATAQAAAGFLDTLLEGTPFPVRAIQVDGGSEFKADFERACQERGIRLFVLPPRSPKLNGCVERAQRTHREEFYQVVDLPETIGELRQKLRAWEVVYNTRRPHQALGYVTPQAWYHQWLTTQTEMG